MATSRAKAKQRISYDSAHGHRLGVDGLAIDQEHSILYSGGRDGAICAWDLNTDFTSNSNSSKAAPRATVQAHTHWVNDIALVQNGKAVVSASSDCSVKIWRPDSEATRIPDTVGLHTDFAKCLASPGAGLDWIASGGFDKTIRVWDLNTSKEKLQIDANEGDKANKKGSIYALKVAGGVMASGAPDGIVRIWDYRSGRRITRLTGHTSFIRAILINDLGDTVMSASSDQSIKVWSLKTGRCMHTLTMHNDSVWRLWSDDPELTVFYSADRDGVIAKTDARYRPSLDEALSVKVAKETEMVTNMAVAGDHIWVSTPNSSINRWRNANTDLDRPPPAISHGRHASLASRPRGYSETASTNFGPEIPEGIPPASVLATTAVARAEASASKFKDLEGFNPSFAGKSSEIQITVDDEESTKPIREKPEETIEGQIGLRRHTLLNDRRRVLTVDTSHGVVLWDLITCTAIHNYGKCDLDKLAEELNTEENIPNWCSIDTGTGRLAVTLNENEAFDAEIYGDELGLGDSVEFSEQQRVQYGRWVLTHLFSDLTAEEIRRDQKYRATLQAQQQSPSMSPNAHMPSVPETKVIALDDENVISSRSIVTSHSSLAPGFGIGVATPGIFPTTPGAAPHSPLLTAKTSGTDLDRQTSRTSGDYFTRSHGTQPAAAASAQPPASSGKESEAPPTTSEGPQSPTDEKEAKGGFFSGKNFRMKFPKKLGRTSSEVVKSEEEKPEEVEKAAEEDMPVFDDNFMGSVQAIRHEYAKDPMKDAEGNILSGIVEAPIDEAPPTKIPDHVTVVIQEEKADAGGVVDLYRGTVGSIGKDTDVLEKLAPQWLGDLLLRNLVPAKDPNRITKQAFVLVPMDDELPALPSDQPADPDNASQPPRLTAPRILRTKKVVEYVAERLNPPDRPVAPDGPPPEEYLEIYCSNRLVPLKMTLQTVRAMIWRGGADIVLNYKSNGKWPAFDAHYGVGKEKTAGGETAENTEAQEGQSKETQASEADSVAATSETAQTAQTAQNST